MTKICLLSLFVCTLVLLGGCASSSSIPQTSYMPEASLLGLVEDRSHYPTLLYQRPGTAKIGSYDRYIVSDVRIRIANSDQVRVPPKDMEYMADYLKVAIRHELSKAGYQVGPGYAQSALRMEFVLSGFEFIKNANETIYQTEDKRSNGQWLSSMRLSTIIVEGAFIDAKANRVEAIAVNRTKPQGFEDGRWWSTWEDVENSLDEWAVGIRKAVDATQ